MARKPNPAPEAVADGTTTEILDAKGRALATHSSISTEISSLFADGLPYDRERAIGMARTYMAASAEAMLEVGKALIQIKENEPHGEFIDILENRLRIPARSAQKMMAASVKFMAPTLQSKAPTLALLGKSKLFELMLEDDEDLQALAEGGTLAGNTLDEIQTMSARELRAALLEERKKTAAKDRVIASKDAKLNKLAEADELRRNGSPDEREQAQRGELSEVGLAAELALQRLVAAVDAITRDPATDAACLEARQTLDFIAQRLADLCGEAGVAVDVLGERVEPGWRRDLTDMAQADPARAAKALKRATTSRG